MQFAQNFPGMESPRPPMFGMSVQQPGPTESTASWLHVPPTHMPWGMPIANQPSIVRFTAELPEPDHKPGLLCGSMPMQCKRKMDPEMELPQSKQHITEEKMAAHMSQLHISPSYTSHLDHGQGDTQGVQCQEQHFKRLVLCEEIRQLQSEPILPSSLLCKLEKPTMALVLWQPPAGNVGEALRQAAGDSRRSLEEQERERRRQQQVAFVADNNNTSGAVDLNSLAMPGFGQSAGPMDL